jgi:hypothetical protein
VWGKAPRTVFKHNEEVSMSVIFWAGRGLEKLDEAALKQLDDSDDYAEKLITVEGNSDAPQIAVGVEVGATYRCAEETFFSFPQGWRYCRKWTEKLWDMVGCSEEEVLAAGSTVAFRDYFIWAQNGTFGPKASSKLAAEFAESDEQAKTLADPEFYETYAFMRTMFEWGAKDGLIYLRSA